MLNLPGSTTGLSAVGSADPGQSQPAGAATASAMPDGGAGGAATKSLTVPVGSAGAPILMRVAHTEAETHVCLQASSVFIPVHWASKALSRATRYAAGVTSHVSWHPVLDAAHNR